MLDIVRNMVIERMSGDDDIVWPQDVLSRHMKSSRMVLSYTHK
jgi:hypothetical protein